MDIFHASSDVFARRRASGFWTLADLALDKTILQARLRKIVNPAIRRARVRWVIDSYRLSERWAPRATGAHLFPAYATGACAHRTLRRGSTRVEEGACASE